MADMTSESGLREKIARVIYDDLEGPVANQDFCRQQRQWEQCLRIADSLAALISPAGGVSVDRDAAAKALGERRGHPEPWPTDYYDVDAVLSVLSAPPRGREG